MHPFPLGRLDVAKVKPLFDALPHDFCPGTGSSRACVIHRESSCTIRIQRNGEFCLLVRRAIACGSFAMGERTVAASKKSTPSHMVELSIQTLSFRALLEVNPQHYHQLDFRIGAYDYALREDANPSERTQISSL
jgi:hypothetical protein